MGRRVLDALALLYGLAGLALAAWAASHLGMAGLDAADLEMAGLDLANPALVRPLVAMGLGLVFAAGLFATLCAARATRAMVVLNVTAAALGLYGFQAYVDVTRKLDHESYVARREARTGQPFDRRGKVAVLADLRAQGVDAYPDHAGRLLDTPLEIGGRPAMALTGRARRPTVMCNRSGVFTVFDSDRYGFNNPDDAWPAPGERAGIVAIGDSFTYGACVAPGEAFTDRLRARWPGTLSLGYGGAGPLAELAALTEYAALVQPRVLLWVYFENDVENLIEERRQPLLLRYLEPDNTLGLAGLQEHLDRLIDARLDEAMADRDGGRADLLRRLVNFVLLRRLREQFGLGLPGEFDGRNDPATQAEMVRLLGRVLIVARDRVAAWGGRMYVVYLPSIEHFAGTPATAMSRLREPVLAEVRAAGLPLIDLKPAMAALPAPAERFFYFPGSHYSPAGYALVAETIVRALEADGAVAAAE